MQQPTGTERCTDHGSGEADPSQASLDATGVSVDALPAISETLMQKPGLGSALVLRSPN